MTNPVYEQKQFLASTPTKKPFNPEKTKLKGAKVFLNSQDRMFGTNNEATFKVNMPCDFTSSNVAMTLTNFIPTYPSGADAGIVHVNMVGVENPHSYSSCNNSTHRTIGTFALTGESVLKEYPPAAMNTDTVNITGQAYGNGSYTARSSANHTGSFPAWRAFDRVLLSFRGWNSPFGTYDFGTGVHIGSNITLVDGSNVSGEWLDLQTPQGIVVNQYRIRGEPVDGQGNLRSPSTFTLAGSTDGINYTRIDTRSNIDTVPSADWWNTYDIPSNRNMYNYYRIIAHIVGNAGATNFRNGCIISEVIYNGLASPQDGFSSITSILSNDTTSPVNAFDYNSNTVWRTGNQYNSSNGVYQGTNFSVVDGSNMTGEWLEIQTAQPIILQNYTLTGDGNSNATPHTFTMAASSNGTTYTRIHTQSNINNWSAPWSFTFSNSNLPTSISYNRFRLLTHTVGNGGNTGRTYVGLREMRLTGFSNVAGGGTIGEWFNAPPVAMTGNTTNISGQPAGNGTYSVSSSYAGASTFNFFDKSATNVSSPANLYNDTTGIYTGSNSTLVGTSNMTGEWIQINVPYPISVAQLTIEAVNGLPAEVPNTFSLVAGNTGGMFNHVFTISNVGNWGSNNAWFRDVYSSGGTPPTGINNAGFPTTFYQNWRLLFHQVGNSNLNNGRNRLTIREIYLRGFNSNIPYISPPAPLTTTSTTISSVYIGNGTYTTTSSSNIVISNTSNITSFTRIGQCNMNAEVISTDRRMFDRPITLQLTSPTGLNLSTFSNWSCEIDLKELP
jgi:hypothetical protein